MMGYPSDRLLEEVAYIAYYLHWNYEEIMSLEHRERQWWAAEIGKVNQKLNEAERESAAWR